MLRHPLEVNLFKAIKANDAKRASELIAAIFAYSESPESPKLNAKNKEGQSFLHYALAYGAVDTVIFDKLFPYYYDQDDVLLSSDNEDCSLLWWATMRGRADIVEKLLAIYQKKQNERKEASKPLLLARDSWLKPNKKGITPLHLAASSSNSTLLPLLFSYLEKQDDYDAESINQVDKKNNAPLHYACKSKRREQIIFLLNKGADFKISAFYTYIERYPSLLSDKTLNINIKRQILADYRKQIILNPDNKALKEFHKVFSAKAGLRELAHEMILLSDASQQNILEVFNKSQAKLAATLQDRLDSSSKMMEAFSTLELSPLNESTKRKEYSKLHTQYLIAKRARDTHALATGAPSLTALGISEAELHANKLYQQIAKDKKSLLAYANAILTQIEKIEKDKAEEIIFFSSPRFSLSLKMLAMWISTGYLSVAIFLGFGVAPFLLGSWIFIPLVVTLGVVLIASLAVLAISGTLIIEQNKLIYTDTKAMLPEAKELLAKLTDIQNKNVNNSPDDITFIKEFSETINSLESINYKRHDKIIKKLKSLRSFIITIADAMETADKPITPMIEIEEDLAVVATAAPDTASTPDKVEEVAIDMDAATNETKESNSEELDRMLQNLPDVSNFPRFHAAPPRTKDEEAISLLDKAPRDDEINLDIGI